MSYVPGQNLVTTNPEQWQDRLNALQVAVNQDEIQNMANEYTAPGAISPLGGTAFLKAGGTSAIAMTLAAPIAGPKPAGQDGVVLTLIAEDAALYAITGPSNSINGAKTTATFGGGSSSAAGNSIEIIARNGYWWTSGTPLGVALT